MSERPSAVRLRGTHLGDVLLVTIEVELHELDGRDALREVRVELLVLDRGGRERVALARLQHAQLLELPCGDGQLLAALGKLLVCNLRAVELLLELRDLRLQLRAHLAAAHGRFRNAVFAAAGAALLVGELLLAVVLGLKVEPLLGERELLALSHRT